MVARNGERRRSDGGYERGRARGARAARGGARAGVCAGGGGGAGRAARAEKGHKW